MACFSSSSYSTNFLPFVNAHKQNSRLIWTWKQHFQLMCPHPCRLIPSGKMKEKSKTWPSVSVCLSFALPLSLFVFFFRSFSLFRSDPGFFFRVLGWHQACMLGERREPLEVFPQAVYLPKSHEHQPVLPHHHPASGTRITISPFYTKIAQCCCSVVPSLRSLCLTPPHCVILDTMSA